MNLNDVYDFLYDWINYVLNTRYNYNIPIIIGSQNVPAPAETYIVIHEPPMSNDPVGNTQVKENYVEYEDDEDLVGTSYKKYSNTWQATINLEEVNSSGIYLPKLKNTIEEDTIKDLWLAQQKISFVDMNAGNANNDLIGNIIEKRYNQELVLYYTEETIIESEIIESVEISERTYVRGG